jgi:hypothetical protein
MNMSRLCDTLNYTVCCSHRLLQETSGDFRVVTYFLYCYDNCYWKTDFWCLKGHNCNRSLFIQRRCVAMISVVLCFRNFVRERTNKIKEEISARLVTGICCWKECNDNDYVY